jgi:diphthine synthase
MPPHNRLTYYPLVLYGGLFSRGRKIYEPPRYMTPTIALGQIISAIQTAELSAENLPTSSSTHTRSFSEGGTLALSLSRVGTPTQSIRSGTIASLAVKEEDFFGGPLHSLVIVGHGVHPMEIQYAAQWAVDEDEWWSVAEKYYGVARETSR